MPSSVNGEHPFQLEISEVIAEVIRGLQRQAKQEGRGEAFLLAVKKMVKRLHRNPTNFGEPLYRLPVLRMQVRCGIIRPLSVDFAVCEDRPLVFLMAVKLLSAT
jgi:hypothetical protein